jgi:type II secretory pathway pseudopilin PulG
MLEMVASIVVTGIIAVTVLPLINGAVDAQSKAAAVRVETENLAFAMERMVRTLRDAPDGATNGTVGITSATASSIALSDGRQFSFAAGEITMRSGGTSATLCRGVTTLEFTLLGEDGITSTSSTLDRTRRINIRLVGATTELRSSVFIRVGFTQ